MPPRVPPGRQQAGVSLPRALSKLGICSRSDGERAVLAGRVRVNGRVVRDPACRIDMTVDTIALDEADVVPAERVYVALNKPRGLVTTRSDPQNRDTVYRCLEGSGLPFVSPVGRLDKASEGLLLLTNDTRWAAGLASPESHVEKVYHVQVDTVPTADLAARIVAGVDAPGAGAAPPEHLAARRASVLRTGARHGWLEIVLDEGRNRHIRRLLDALGIEVLRLVRVAIGDLALGALAKGEWRLLTAAEVKRLSRRS